MSGLLLNDHERITVFCALVTCIEADKVTLQRALANAVHAPANSERRLDALNCAGIFARAIDDATALAQRIVPTFQPDEVQP